MQDRVYGKKIQDADDLRVEWEWLDQSVIDSAIRQWRCPVKAKFHYAIWFESSSNQLRTSSEPTSVMEFGFNGLRVCIRARHIHFEHKLWKHKLWIT